MPKQATEELVDSCWLVFTPVILSGLHSKVRQMSVQHYWIDSVEKTFRYGIAWKSLISLFTSELEHIYSLLSRSTSIGRYQTFGKLTESIFAHKFEASMWELVARFRSLTVGVDSFVV